MQVELIDREAAVEYWNGLADEWNSWTEISGQERDATVQAFARHRHQARAEQAAELAKFKAQAETLAGALEPVERLEMWSSSAKDSDMVVMSMATVRKMREAYHQYKEATNV